MTLAVVRIMFGSAGGTSCCVEASVERYMCRVDGIETVKTRDNRELACQK